MSRKKSSVQEEAAKALAAQSDQSQRELVVRRADQIEQRAVEWLWLGRYPCGKLTAIVGDPGYGKSQVALDAARCVTTGSNWPDGAKGTGVPANVVILSAEDEADDTMVPRLDFIGADLTRIIIVDASKPIGDALKLSPVNLINDIEALEKTIKETGDVKLVILDPVNEYLGGVNTDRTGEVRAALSRLRMLTAKYKFAVLMIMHLNKSDKQSAIQRISGSMAFAALIRKGFFVIPGKDRATDRIFVPAKSNVGIMGMSLSFKIEAENNNPYTARTKITWGDSMGFIEIDQVLTEQNNQRTSGGGERLKFAIEAVKTVMNEGPVAPAVLEDRVKAMGVSAASLRRARAQLRIVTVKGRRRTDKWNLRLVPDDEKRKFQK